MDQQGSTEVSNKTQRHSVLDGDYDGTCMDQHGSTEKQKSHCANRINEILPVSEAQRDIIHSVNGTRPITLHEVSRFRT